MKELRMFFLLISLAIVLAACSGEKLEKPSDLDYKVQDFDYKNQDGKSISLSDLKGKVWVADFVFSNCNTVCPSMTNNMANLQRNIKEAGLENVEIVSFSVDPEVDSPKVLKEFGSKFNADFSNWHFLTGYSQQEVEEFAKDNFKASVQKTDQSDQVIHGTSFYLVDQNGTVVTNYSGTDRSDKDDQEVINDIKALLQ